VIVQICGGLCNQLFQYSFGRSVSLAKNEELFFDVSRCRSEDQYTYSLDAFHTKVTLAEGRTGPRRGEPVFKFDPTVYNDPPGMLYDGYWQTERYFNIPIIREELKFKIKPRPIALELAAEIKKGVSASIHVRGGDYLRDPHRSFHGLQTLDYYNEAIARIRAVHPQCTFWVFSDNPDWCRQNFPDFTLVEGTNKFEDLQLMSYCTHSIIVNSSFSWFGAWLGEGDPDKIVIAPKKWFADPNMCYSDVVPERWIKI
jgi:hypothetical protein